MPNKNYLAGRRLEWQRKKHYENMGYTVLRSAGSHGPFDLTVIDPGGSVILIQLKRVKDAATASRLCREFEKNPPLLLGDYTQVLEVYIPRVGIFPAYVGERQKEPF